ETGVFKVTVVVTDALGRVSASSPLTVTVKGATSSSGSAIWSGVINPFFLYPLLLAIALAAVAVAYLASRKRQRKNNGHDDNTKTDGDKSNVEHLAEWKEE
ncbi:MAG: hypothetical protein JRN35_09240, partial [Nitrososphaerota archaeon]|nr:hypothetical protein [Nitrososphaerota archaeon]